MEYRTNTHAHAGKTNRSGKAVRAFVILLSIVLIAAIIALSPLGEYLSEHVLRPIFASADPKPKQDDQIVSALTNQENSPLPTVSVTPQPVQNELNISETPFYILQMGAFTEQGEAEEHAKKLRAMGAAGMVYQDGSVFRVFAAAYGDQESLEKVQSQVRSDGFEATPYITDSNSVRLSLKGDATAVHTTDEAVALLSKVPSDLTALSLEFDMDSIDGIDLKQTLKDRSSELDQILEQYKMVESDSIEPIRNVLEKYQKRISTFLQEHDTISKMNSGDLKLLQIECITDYILFFEQG